ASLSQGVTYDHEPDFFARFVLSTAPASSFADLSWRRANANNQFFLRIRPTGTHLHERNGGTLFERASSAAVTSGQAVEMVVQAASVKIYVAGVLVIDYGSASSFQNEIAGRSEAMGGGAVITNFETWPVWAEENPYA